jgi:hypothetical protein
MFTPPLFAGAVHLSVTCALPAVGTSPDGAPGGVPAIGDAVMVTLEVADLGGELLSVTVSLDVYVPAAV